MPSGRPGSANRAITSSFSAEVMRPVRAANRNPANGPAASSGRTDSTAAPARAAAPPAVPPASPESTSAGSPSDSATPDSMRGQTTYTWRPAATSSRARCQARAR